MSVRRLQASIDQESATYRPWINTGGPLDIINGKFVPGIDGKTVLSGGLGLTTAIIATPNKFKSTLQNTCAVNALARWPESELKVFDTEYSSLDKNRLANMSSLYLDEPEKRAQHLLDLEGRIELHDPLTDRGASLEAWFDYLKEIRDEKVKNFKDWMVETEILDPSTGKPYRMMLPTFGGIDSWTEATVSHLNAKNDAHNADTEMKDQRTINMDEGWQKTRLMRQLPSICAKGGIYILMTGQLGRKFSLDGKPVAKDMQFMGQDETTKSMGPKFEFLMSSIFKIGSTSVLADKNDRRESEYPSAEHMSGTELLQLMITLVRSKNSPSGAQTTAVSSQKFGIMAGLSYYDYLRNNKYFGLGAPNKVRSPFLGDTNLGRTKIFDMARDYKIERVLELTYQLFIIQSTWSLLGQPVDYSINIEQFADKLNNSSYAADDILNSRGWWTYKDAKVDREFLTLPDILNILSDNYKPKHFSVTK